MGEVPGPRPAARGRPFYNRTMTATAPDPKPAARSGAGARARVAVGPGVFALLLGLVGLQGLGKEMWYDEAYTVLCYVVPGASFSLTHLAVPNNHVLYSVLLSPLARWHVEPLYRLPSLIAAAVAVWLTGRAARGAAEVPARLRWTVVLAVFVAFPAFLSTATQIRGYALAMALVAACMALLLPAPGGRTVLRGAAYALAGAAAVATVATSVLPLAALALFDLARAVLRGRPRVPELAALAAPHLGVAAGFAAYAPMWRDVVANARRGWGVATGTLAVEVTLALVLPFVILAAAALVLGRGRERATGARGWSDHALLALACAAVTGVVIVAGVRLFPRSFTGFIPLATAAVAGCAMSALARRPRTLFAAAVATAVVGQAYWQLSVNVALADGRWRVARVLLPAQYEARDFDPSQAVATAIAARAPGGVVFVDNRDPYCDEMALYYYGVMAGAERAIAFAPRGVEGVPPPAQLAGAVVVSRDAAGREAIAGALGLPAARWQVLKGGGHFKVWRLLGGA